MKKISCSLLLLGSQFLPAEQVGYYPFDGDATDASGNGNDLTGYAVDGTTLPVITPNGGRVGGFATFDGQNLFNTGFVPVEGNAARTLMMFVRSSTDNSTSTGGTTMFFGGWGSPLAAARVRYDLGLQGGSNNQLRNEFNAGASTSSISGPITDGEWHHLAVKWDGTATATFYLDGAPNGSEISGEVFTDGLVGLTIGGDTRAAGVLTETTTNTPNRYFTGDIDEVRVFDEALSDAKILAFAQAEGTGEAGIQVTSSGVNDDGFFEIEVRNLTTDLEYDLFASEDLVTWDPVDVAQTADGSGIATFTTGNPVDPETSPTLFYRVEQLTP